MFAKTITLVALLAALAVTAFAATATSATSHAAGKARIQLGAKTFQPDLFCRRCAPVR